MTDTAREITPITFLNDGNAKSNIRDFSPHVQAVERRLEVVPEPTVEEVLATVEPPVLTPEEEEALAAEAAAEAELTAELAAGTAELSPDPTSPPVAPSDTPEASDQTEPQPVEPVEPVPPVPPSTRVTKKLPPAPA